MEYTATQLSTIIEFLDTIGSASFMSGFKDGLYDIRCELNGEEYTPVPDTSHVLIALFRHIAIASADDAACLLLS